MFTWSALSTAREKRLIDSGVIALGIISLTAKKEKKYYRTDDKADICTIPPMTSLPDRQRNGLMMEKNKLQVLEVTLSRD